MLNAIGLQNPGVDHVIAQILPALDFTETRFIANVCGSTIEDYIEVTRRFDDSPIDAIEVNISCPNIKEGGVQFGNYPQMSGRVTAACRAATKKPLIVKLSPNQTDIRENARYCIEAGADALAVINTVTGMAPSCICTFCFSPVSSVTDGAIYSTSSRRYWSPLYWRRFLDLCLFRKN